MPHHGPRAVRALIPHLDYYGESRPTVKQGGDLFDFVPLLGGALSLFIGEAEFALSKVQNFLRGCVADLHGDPAEVITEVNKFACKVAPGDLSGMLFCARLDPVHGEFRYASARQPALLVRKRTNRVRELESTGTVLGLSSRVGWRERRFQMEPGDLIAAFTGDPRSEDVSRILLEDPRARATDLVRRILYETECHSVVVARFLGEEVCQLEEESAELALAVA